MLQDLGAKLGPHVWPPREQEEDEGQEAGRGVPGGEQHVHDLIAQHDRVLRVLGELLQEDVRLLLGGVAVRAQPGLLALPVLEGACDELLGVGVHGPARASELLVTVGEHQVAEPQPQDGSLLRVVEGVVELSGGFRRVLVHEADGFPKHVLAVGVQNLQRGGKKNISCEIWLHGLSEIWVDGG